MGVRGRSSLSIESTTEAAVTATMAEEALDGAAEPQQKGAVTRVRSNEAVANDNAEEHQLSVQQVVRNHKTLVWWAFFFAVSAVGW